MRTSPSPRGDAVDLLDADHVAVKKLFNEFNELAQGNGSAAKRRSLADRICFELSVHAQLEEEMFYPPVRRATGEEDAMNEADVEHEGVRRMIAELSAMHEGDSHDNAKVKVLGELVDHHVAEERSKIFPKARASNLDLVGMAAQLKDRKEQIVRELSQALA